MEYVVHRTIRLSEGRSIRYDRELAESGLGRLPPPAALAIAQIPPNAGFYLIGFDAEGREQHDTFHETFEEALAQAEWEFDVKPSEWTVESV